MLGHGLFRPILPIFARRVGASGLEVGLLTSGFMLARGITAFLTGKGADLSGHRKTFVSFGFFFVFIITCGYVFMENYSGLLILRFGQGICSGLIWPATQIMVAEEAGHRFRARALSLYQITGRLGALLSRALLSLVLLVTVYIGIDEMGSFRIVFLVGGIILFLGFLETFLVPDYKRKNTLKRRGAPPYALFFIGFVFGALLALAPLSLVHLNEYYGISALGIAILLLCLDVITMCAMYASSHITDLIGVKRSLWIVIVPAFTTALFLPLARAFLGFIVLYFLLRMAVSSFMPISRAYATSIDGEIGSNIGTLNMVTNLGSVVGPVIGGLVYDSMFGSFRIAGYSVVAALLVPAVVILLRTRLK
jgi:MFS family permease